MFGIEIAASDDVVPVPVGKTNVFLERARTSVDDVSSWSDYGNSHFLSR